MMKRMYLSALFSGLVFLLASACTPPTIPAPSAQLANPAATHCIKQGHRYETRSDEAGNQYGVCVFAGGAECDAWAYLRDECGADESSAEAQPQSINLVQNAHLIHTIRIDVIIPFGVAANTEAPAADRTPAGVAINSIVDPQRIAAILAALDAPLPLQAHNDCPAYYSLRFITSDGRTHVFGYACSPKQADFLRGSAELMTGYDVIPPARFKALLAAYLTP